MFFAPAAGGLGFKLGMIVVAIAGTLALILFLTNLGGARAQRDIAVQNLAACAYELDLILDEIAASDNLDKELYDRVREYQWRLLEPVPDEG